MKLLESILTLLEKDDEDKDISKAPPAGDMGKYVTTAQAARMLNVGMSRIRQLVSDGELTSKQPTKGRRDHLILQKDVESLKKQERKAGRPEED